MFHPMSPGSNKESKGSTRKPGRSHKDGIAVIRQLAENGSVVLSPRAELAFAFKTAKRAFRYAAAGPIYVGPIP
jgi:hypothetical protein